MRKPARQRALLVAVAFLGFSGLAIAQSDVRLPKGPTLQDEQITQGLTGFLQIGHMTQHPLDDEVSRRCFDGYIRSLDPMKIYFMQADLDELGIYRERLDDLAREHDITFAYLAFHRFLERADERVSLVLELIDSEPDFTAEEEIVTDRDLLSYSKTDEEVRERWRKRVKFDLLYEIADGSTMEGARATLKRRYESFLKRMNQTDRNRLLELYLGSLTGAYDPHTTYMSPRTLENFEISMSLELEGIGAALRSLDGYVTVSYLIPGGAADRDGRLQPEDKIVGVAQGEEGAMEHVIDWNLSDVVPMVRGKRGTIVRLEVIPNDGSGKKVYVLTRDKVELKDSEAFGKVFEEGTKASGEPYRVGVIDLPSFYRDMSAASKGIAGFRSTTRDVRRILEDFRAKNVDAVILDLRRNGGGSLTEAIDLTGLFIDEGPVVQVKNSFGQVKHYDDPDDSKAWAGPLVVLTSKLSASASEILAGAIQDYGRGLVVGDAATHGKGTVQTLIDIGEQLGVRNLGALKITTQQFYRPTGDSTQHRGVMADIELPSFTTHMDVGESDLDHSLPFDRVEPVKFDRTDMTPEAILDQLEKRSTDRVAKSEDFKKLKARVQRYIDRKDRTKVTLNKEEFLADRKSIEEEEDEAKEATGEEPRTREPTIERNYYLDEAIAIALDYAKLLKSPKLVLN